MEIYFQLIRDAEGVERAVRDLANERVLGFDCETTELDPYRGVVRLVQLSTGSNTYVFDLRPFGEGEQLKKSDGLAPLRFAGEHTAYGFIGYMEGALSSGVRVAKDLVAAHAAAKQLQPSM